AVSVNRVDGGRKGALPRNPCTPTMRARPRIRARLYGRPSSGLSAITSVDPVAHATTDGFVFGGSVAADECALGRLYSRRFSGRGSPLRTLAPPPEESE